MKLSLIFPIKNGLQQASAHFQDLKSFWLRFDIEIELIFVVDAVKEETDSQWHEALKIFHDSSKFKTVFVFQKKILGRGPSVITGLGLATGELLGIMSFDFSIPIGEVFASISEFHEHKEPLVLVGNRRGTKKIWRRLDRPKRNRIEEIEFEKAQGLNVPDPTCPLVLINRAAIQKILPLKTRRWFYSPQIIKKARDLKIPVVSRDIQAIDIGPSQISWWDLFR